MSNKLLKNLLQSYNKTSVWCKILIFTTFLVLFIFMFKLSEQKKEGFIQEKEFVIKSGTDIYDDFYSNIYDYLVYNNAKDIYEIGQIINMTNPTSKSKILDIGCGTGHHSALLNKKGFEVLGIDISSAMIKQAKKNYSNIQFNVADALDNNIFEPNSFTHILCLYFTIYYFSDKSQFFYNCMKWLMPGGYLIIHVVDKEKFDPILPPGNPLLFVSPQRYAKQRITTTKVKFNDFDYNADFKLDEKNDNAYFIEKFKNFKDGKTRKNEHVMYMSDIESIVADAQSAGFIMNGKIDLIHCQYEYQYLYVFIKPN